MPQLNEKEKAIEEAVDKLLRGNVEDIGVGIHLAVIHLGEEWCKENFKFKNYRTDHLSLPPGVLFRCYGEFSIWVGNIWIDYVGLLDPDDFENYSPTIIID